MASPSWAKGITILTENTVVQTTPESNPITIREENRATVFVRTQEGLEIVKNILRNNYLNKKVDAVLVGVDLSGGVQYAVYVQDDFLV